MRFTSDRYMAALPFIPFALLASAVLAGALAQGQAGSVLPPTPPTQATAPLAAAATPADRAGARRHRAQVNCAGGQLEVRADNSSLNGILRAVAQCTGMKITGGVADQRVYGNYGPAAPATVLATLLDGTGTNVLLKETASDQPSELFLTPRTGGVTPPAPSQVADDEADEEIAPNPIVRSTSNNGAQYGRAFGTASQVSATVPTAGSPSPQTGPVSIPQPMNNVLGSPTNTSPNAATYPTTNSVPLDSLPTPSTTPNQTGIVSAPNPPAAGSDTAALLNGRTTNMPGNTSITDQPTSTVESSAEGNTTGPNGNGTAGNSGTSGTGATTNSSGTLTPQQVFEQLQKLRQAAQPSTPGTTTLPQPQ